MSKLKIFYYTPYFDRSLNEAFGFSPSMAEDLCTVSTDSRDLAAADAVLFHLPNLKQIPPIGKRPGQLWVAMSMESDVNYPLQVNAAYMRHFDLRMNFRRNSDVPMLYFYPGHVPDLLTPPKWKYRRAPAVYFASNDHALNNRYQLVEGLMQHLKIDSYGKSQNNRKLLWDKRRETKLKVISRYLFYLAFENSNSVDYVSEKVFDGLIAGTVPVYLGAPNIDDYLPGKKCIIKASDFGNAAELGKYLLSLQKNRNEYENYLTWKKEPLQQSFLDLIEQEKTPALRRLCYKLMELRTSQ